MKGRREQRWTLMTYKLGLTLVDTQITVSFPFGSTKSLNIPIIIGMKDFSRMSRRELFICSLKTAVKPWRDISVECYPGNNGKSLGITFLLIAKG
jgi:hypothetical protein